MSCEEALPVEQVCASILEIEVYVEISNVQKQTNSKVEDEEDVKAFEREHEEDVDNIKKKAESSSKETLQCRICVMYCSV